MSLTDPPVSPPADPYGRGASQDAKPRCWRCKRLLAEMVTRPWSITCTRCKAQNVAE